MTTTTKHKRYYRFLELKYKRLIEEAYNIQYTDHSRSDILTFEALNLRQKIVFLQL